MKKKIVLFFSLLTLFVVSIPYVSYAYGPITPPKQTTAGKIYGPYYQWIKGSNMNYKDTLTVKAKNAVISRYGSVNKNKSYCIKYFNEVKPAGWGFSQKGYIIRVTAVGSR